MSTARLDRVFLNGDRRLSLVPGFDRVHVSVESPQGAQSITLSTTDARALAYELGVMLDRLEAGFTLDQHGKRVPKAQP
jgi:hypothetical protein